ncbi:DUF1552 domain-containing protein [Nannocystis pusilla]|uniref:DUF1552 domain-containing protein n=1 Tax=Nannocystis pusilla TaxID=889268 RepID=UPI003B7BC662
MRRRMFLRGAGGVAVALPLLESLVGRRGTARAAEPGSKRLVVFFTCNGVNLESFFPQTPGPLTMESLMGSALEPLAGYRDRLLVPRGLHMVPKGWGTTPAPRATTTPWAWVTSSLRSRSIRTRCTRPASPSINSRPRSSITTAGRR